jgi:predicted aldo/keto reductase-like oxidoreductase
MGQDALQPARQRQSLVPRQQRAEVDEAALAPALTHSPFAARIPGVLRDAHALLAGEAKKRLSEGG